jgi:hypothetical protein
MTEPMCSTCRVAMEEGFMVDHGHLNSPTQAAWADGAPRRSWFGNIKLRGTVQIAAVTYRCPRCGVLQSYARDAESTA